MLPQFPISGSYEDLIMQAEQLMDANEFEQARPILERIHRRLSKLSPAMLSRQPNLDEIRILSTEMLADIHRHNKDFRQAIDLYQYLLDTTPPEFHPQWQHIIARLKADNGQTTEALDELRALAVAHASADWPWLSLGQVFLEGKKYDEAIVNLKKALDRTERGSEERYWTMNTLFVAYKEMGRYADAEATWLEMMKSGDVKKREYFPIYAMYYEAGLPEEAQRWLKKEQNPYRLGLYRGLLAQARGDTDAAMKYWSEAAARTPKDSEAHPEDWAEVALRANVDPLEIMRTLARFFQAGQVTGLSLFMYAIAAVRAGDMDRAHDAFADVTEDNLLTRWDWKIFTELTEPPAHDEFAKYFQLDDA